MRQNLDLLLTTRSNVERFIVLLHCSVFDICRRNIKLFSQDAEKANFPYFKHNNSADNQCLNAKFSGHVVTSLRFGRNLK